MTAAPALTLRPITEADMPLLFRIYAATREEELAQVPWTPEQKQAFLVMQFNAQHTDYQRNYSDASFDVIEGEDGPVGRLYLHRRENEFCIIDIAILPEHRNAGIGTQFINEVIEEADSLGRPVTIHVERYNPALKLYLRLGFVEVGGNDIYLLMEHQPSHRPTPSN
jgi:GNAT superfamily N-acetyltransferase